MTQDETINQLVKQCALDADLAAEWKTRAEELSAQLQVEKTRAEKDRSWFTEVKQANDGLAELLDAANARVAELEAMAKGDREALHRVLDERDAANARVAELERSYLDQVKLANMANDATTSAIARADAAERNKAESDERHAETLRQVHKERNDAESEAAALRARVTELEGDVLELNDELMVLGDK